MSSKNPRCDNAGTGWSCPKLSHRRRLKFRLTKPVTAVASLSVPVFETVSMTAKTASHLVPLHRDYGSLSEGIGIGTRHFGSGLVGGEHPVDLERPLWFR